MNKQRHQPKSGSRNPSPNRGNGKVVELRPNKAPSAALPERVAALEQNQLGLVQFFNQNMGAFKGGMLAVDAMLHVLQRIFQDLGGQQQGRLSGWLDAEGNPELVHVHVDAVGMIDFPYYLREYYGFIGFVEFIVHYNAWSKTHTVNKKEDGTFEIVSTVEEAKEAATAAEAEELSSAVAGPPPEDEEITTVFGGDGAS